MAVGEVGRLRSATFGCDCQPGWDAFMSRWSVRFLVFQANAFPWALAAGEESAERLSWKVRGRLREKSEQVREAMYNIHLTRRYSSGRRLLQTLLHIFGHRNSQNSFQRLLQLPLEVHRQPE